MKSSAVALLLSLPMAGVTAFAADNSFYEKAAQGGTAEVMAGKLAANKGTSAEVRDFGAMMVKDHGAANEKLANIAKAKGVALPTAAGKEHLDEMKSLQAQDGARFDSAYLAGQVKAHEETVELLKTEIASGQDAEAKAFAQEIMPTVQSHLRKLYQLTGQNDKAASLPN